MTAESAVTKTVDSGATACAAATTDGNTRPTERPTAPGLWWLSPAVIPLVVAAAAIVPTAFVSDQTFRASWRSPRSITNGTLVMFGCGAVALAFGALIGIALAASRLPRQPRSSWPGLGPQAVRILQRSSTVLTAATVFGYVGFAVLIVRAGLTPSELLGGATADGTVPIRDQIGTVPGVTTFTQLGIASVVVSTIAALQRFSWAEVFKIALVIALALPRAYINSERLALLELVIPVCVIVAARLSASRGLPRLISQTIPVFGLAVVVVMFGVFEYFRSWNFYRLHGATSFVDFAVNRFAGYYATALNNGELVIDHLQWAGRWPFDTLEAFWSAPGVEALDLYQRVSGHAPPYNRTDQSPYFDVLRQYANPEFNNPSGYAAPFVDYGFYGGLVFLLAVGIGLGLLYKYFAAGRPFGLLLYPVAFIGLVEMPRYLYWVQGRTTYTWIALVAIAVVLATKIRRAEAKSLPGFDADVDAPHAAEIETEE